MRRIHLFILGLVLSVYATRAHGQTFDLQFVEVLNNGANYNVKIQIKSNISTFAMGSSNLVFTYNSAALSSPTLLTAHAFTSGQGNYLAMNIAATSQVSVNIELTVAPGTTVLGTYMDVATIGFTTINPNGNSNLVWVTGGGAPTTVFKDDEATVVSPGTLNNLNTTPLPITLSSFTGQVLQNGAVRLDWTTLSEIENYGFNVERKRSTEQTFVELPNSFIQGHGTTNEPHQYTFTDATSTAGSWQYRLKQIDMDGTVHHTDPVQVDVLTDVKETAPIVFALLQNYPNPFNPETEIKFSVDNTARTTLRIYNLIGQEVATIFDGIAEAGQYYRIKLNGSNLASGVYFYRLQNEKKSELKKMMLVK
ncbi:MAG TPA: T9SS type A sorting domain-containing protein [Bacteroidota bacterium]|nr:T9SS type A sorting domain-containing protein [Bacteroidota bacterium]